ncbi:thiopeptide-type bacteriocin biosynthesis protein [Haloactinospora alba]|uniref:Thiopeptide-type bacteriocin biosynthesis protein n=1 Tax=Haloactinospora alba TaxID=405555 RepID=A0A543N7K7_9ACTN|nr:thiopeptide-type bacteriocin biosynthesis protein [Haloactinospora alba]TQN27811.1 thiopeptide-type bacteriocin biosynthesis protein [Haloactinospora alba]
MPPDDWRQYLITFDTRQEAEDLAAQELRSALATLETEDAITRWFFTRKFPQWRVRYQPAPQCAQHPLDQALEEWKARGRITEWTRGIYEPEEYAFGGPTAMDTAHTLFWHDSRTILEHLSRIPHGGTGQRRELSIMLCSLLMRSAGQDFYEHGDVWARVAEERSLPSGVSREQLHRLGSDLVRLILVDTGPKSPLLREGAPLEWLIPWAEAFSEAGRDLGEHARTGTLTRGLRAVLAHHVLFHFNRIGLSATTQSVLAHAAATAVFDT